jgi:chemotaxis protein MotB
MKRRKRYFSEESSENFWPSFTDLISTIVLILFFLVLLAYVQQIILGNNLKSANAEISKAKENLMLLQNRSEELKAEVERGEMALKLSQKRIKNQKEIIAESNEELGNLRSKLRDVALVRVNVLEQVKEAIEKELGENNREGEELLSVAENGNIILNEGILFDSGSYVIKENSKVLLDKLAKSFEKILEDDDTRKFIDAIEIQGHADERKGSLSNSNLSANRATSVVDYLMKTNPKLKEKYGKYFAASGYSYFRPRVEGSNEEAWQLNRRIEISVILKDPSIRELIDEYLDDSEEMFDESNLNEQEADKATEQNEEN